MIVDMNGMVYYQIIIRVLLILAQIILLLWIYIITIEKEKEIM